MILEQLVILLSVKWQTKTTKDHLAQILKHGAWGKFKIAAGGEKLVLKVTKVWLRSVR